MASMREKRNVYTILVGKSKEVRPLVRPRLRWEDKIKINLNKEDGRAWTEFIWLRAGLCADGCEHLFV
jgi:hypothetical protein